MNILERIRSINVMGVVIYQSQPNKTLHPIDIHAEAILPKFYFWEKQSVIDILISITSAVAIKCLYQDQNPPTVISITEPFPYKCYAIYEDKKIYTCVCHDKYPEYSAFTLLQYLHQKSQINQQPFPPSSWFQTTIQDPGNIDKLSHIQQQLKQIQTLALLSIEKLKIREESLEKLYEKSQILDQQSIHFYKRAKKLNRCCIML